ncbi:MAG: efflux RND transporter permease subunit [Thermoguttaceae bacterium]
MLKNFLRWIISNSPAMNILMITVVGLGLYCGMNLRRETFPNFDLEYVTVTVIYPGATPEEIENGICQKIEEALVSVEGLKKMTATANEGSGLVLLELHSYVKNVDRIVNEVQQLVNGIPSFPELAEKPIVQRVKVQETIISVGVVGPEDYSVDGQLALRQVAEDIREEIKQLPRISMVNLVGTKNYQINVEIPEFVLRQYKKTLSQAANIIRKENVQTPGGTIRAPSQEINVRTDNRRYDGEGIADLPFITRRDGTVIKVGDVADVRDEFVDGTALATVYDPRNSGPADLLVVGNAGLTGSNEVHGKPVVALGVLRNTNEDLLVMVDQVEKYVKEKNSSGTLPQGYRLVTWGDRSIEVRSRLQLLVTNGLQGLCIVFILLALFLDIKLAFWVAMGIPFSMCMSALWLYYSGNTLNMISTFGAIMALGIVVDDAIVVGENIFTHRQRGKNFYQAAVDGTAEVLPAVTTSVLTTIIAFAPLLFISGVMGKIIIGIPIVIIAMLLASLGECFTILPCHLAHKKNLFISMLHGYLYIFTWLLMPLKFLGNKLSAGLVWFIREVYAPTLTWVLHHRGIYMSACLSALIFTVGIVYAGVVEFVFFPKIDGNTIQTTLSFPNGTPAEVTDKWTRHLEDAFWKTANEYEAKGHRIADRSFRVIGTSLQGRGHNIFGAGGGGSSNTGGVQVELVSDGSRKISSIEISNRWREIAGPVPGAEKLSFDTQSFGPGGGAIEVLFVAKSTDSARLKEAVIKCKEKLAKYEGTIDISDSDAPGKWEFRLKIKENAIAMGLQPADLADVIRATYYGAEVQRLQRGRHEVKLMVCYPEAERRSLGDFNEIRIRTANGDEYPITELADIEVVRGYTTITRRNQLRSITVSSGIDEKKGNAAEIIADLKQNFLPALKKEYPEVSTLWEGQEEQRNESMRDIMIGAGVAIGAMFVLLSLQFRSYVQPAIIMTIIPFSTIGMVVAHWLAGYPISQFSIFGLVALSGIVVNDSIVLIDYINTQIRSGEPVKQVLLEAGQRRFRPVMLTSVTTMGGLLPILLERSLQVQIIIPMALSVIGGVAFSLLLVLFLVPVLYSWYIDLLNFFGISLSNILTYHDDSETESSEQVAKQDGNRKITMPYNEVYDQN